MAATSGYRTYIYHHRVWLQIDGDHCRFIENRLAPKEARYLAYTRECKEQADLALAAARSGTITATEAKSVHDNVVGLIKSVHAASLEGKVAITLSPTFLNHMLNESDRYTLLINSELRGMLVPRLHVLDQHKLWLKDAEGHADALATELDAVEQTRRDKLAVIKKEFTCLYAKSEEFVGYMRSGAVAFPALVALNKDAELTMHLFVAMLKELQELKEQNLVLTISDTLEFDHMLREEAYYLEGIADSLGTAPSVSVYNPTGLRKET